MQLLEIDLSFKDRYDLTNGDVIGTKINYVNKYRCNIVYTKVKNTLHLY